MKLGIDFGTCYSSAALLIDGTLHPAKEPLRPLESCFPSSICVTKKGEIVISQAAENLRRLNPQGYKNHFKRDLDTDIPYFLGEQQLRFLPEDLVTVMLRGLKKEAEKIINSSIDSSIITVPATYLINKKQLMEQAAKKAGFNEVALLEEPVAAAIYYSLKGTMGHQLNEGDILLVYDLGGGTFDAALIQKKGNSYDLLGQPVGDKQCGGIYFDQLIAQDFIKQLHENSVLELLTSHRQDKEAIAAKLNLQDWCRNFKHQLSVLDEHEDLPPLGLDSYSLSRDKFEKMLTPFIDSSCDLCQQLVQQSGIKWESINRVLLVGGSCRIPYVQKRLEQQFKRPVVAIDDPELAICFGAAIYGYKDIEIQIKEAELQRQNQEELELERQQKLEQQRQEAEQLRQKQAEVEISLKTFHDYEDYLRWFKGDSPTMEPFSETNFYHSLRFNRTQKLEQQRQEQLKQETAEKQKRQQREAEQLEKAQSQQVAQTTSTDELASEKGINYTNLRDLLKQQNWQAADKETADRMCEAMGRQNEGWLRVEDAQNFPCADLRTIDQLWVKHSRGKFGFSVQKEIWQSCGSPTKSNEKWEKFGELVGWKDPTGWVGSWSWYIYINYRFTLKASKGHLPSGRYFGWGDGGGESLINVGDCSVGVVFGFSSLVRRLVNCNNIVALPN